MTKMFTRALGLAIALSTLAGCGVEGLSTAASTGSLSYQGLSADGSPAPGKGGKMGGRGDKGGKGGFGVAQFANLDLTDEQKAQLQAIAEKYKPAAPAEGTRPENTVQTLLKAETLDVEALKAALAAQPAKPADNHLAILVESRAVLTDAQRATLVEQLKAQAANAPTERPVDANRPAKPDAATRTAEVVEKLGLNETQKAAYEAFVAKLEANKPAEPVARPDHAAHTAAMIAFWETGATTALEALKPQAADRPAFPVDEFVALAQTLTVEQRTQILGRGPGFGGERGGMGGRGGHGGSRGEAPAAAAE